MVHVVIDRSLPRRIVATVLLAVVLLSTAAYTAIGSISIARTYQARPVALLALENDEQRQTLLALDSATLAKAITALPLDPAILNVAMVRNVRLKGDSRLSSWMDTLSRMGWRDNQSQANRLYVAANAGNIKTVFDVCDALLRRKQLLEQLIPTLAMVEGDEQVRGTLAARLAAKPSWRETYLQSTGVITKPEQIMARYAILRTLKQLGSPPTEAEAGANAAAFDRRGRPDLGYAIWASAQPAISAPLNDPSFARVSGRSNDETLIPYEWSLLAGDGFSAEALVEDGHPLLELRWNGRGVPVFARQRTAAQPGVYALRIDGATEREGKITAIGFRMVCNGVAVAFRGDPNEPALYRTEGTVSCQYPVFEITGEVQSSVGAHQFTLQGLRLSRIG